MTKRPFLRPTFRFLTATRQRPDDVSVDTWRSLSAAERQALAKQPALS